MYRALLKSALEHGLNPTVEDDRGRNALFVLCEQMSVIAADQCPDSARLLHIVLDGCGPSGVGGSDRTGRTVFDIEGRVPNSCLSACRQILLDSGAHHRVIPHRSHQHPSSSGMSVSSQASISSHQQRGSSSHRSNGGDWEFQKPVGKPGSNVAAVSGYRYGASEHLRSSSAGSSSAQDQHRRPPTGHAAARPSSYFDDLDEEDDAGSHARPHASSVSSVGSSTRGSAAVAPPYSSYTPVLHKNGGTLR